MTLPPGVRLTAGVGAGAVPSIGGMASGGMLPGRSRASTRKSIKEGDYILGGEPLLNRDGVYHVTDDIKDYKRGFLLRVSKKA